MFRFSFRRRGAFAGSPDFQLLLCDFIRGTPAERENLTTDEVQEKLLRFPVARPPELCGRKPGGYSQLHAGAFGEGFQKGGDLIPVRRRQGQPQLESSPHGAVEQFGMVRGGDDDDVAGEFVDLHEQRRHNAFYLARLVPVAAVASETNELRAGEHGLAAEIDGRAMAHHPGQLGNVIAAPMRGEHERDLFREIDPDSSQVTIRRNSGQDAELPFRDRNRRSSTRPSRRERPPTRRSTYLSAKPPRRPEAGRRSTFQTQKVDETPGALLDAPQIGRRPVRQPPERHASE